MRPRLAAALVALAALALPSVAAADADEKEACAKSYESAQRLRKKGQLRASRRELVECAKAACPAVLSTDCAGWLREVDAALPTIVPVVRDEGGRDILDVKVSVDGELVASRLEGNAIEMDPGAHVFRFVAEGRDPVEQTVLVREGERHRAITVLLPARRALAASTAPGGDAPTRALAEPAMKPPPRTLRPVVLVLGGVGLAAMGGFVYFGMTGLRQESELESCRPDCADASVAATRRSFLVADVLLGVGVASILAGTYFYLKRPSAPSSASVWVAPSVPVGGGFHGSLGARFAP